MLSADEVFIVNCTYAKDPIPEYDAVTSLVIHPWDVLVPWEYNKAQESKLQDPGKLKYSDRATGVIVL